MKSKALINVTNKVLNVYGSWTRETTVQQMRDDWDALYARPLTRTSVEDISIGDIPCRWVNDDDADRTKAIIYLHGGGFRMGSLDSHQGLMADISESAKSSVLGIGYRLCPEQSYPAALEDTYHSYQWLLENGFPAENIAIAGDSAGGNLVASLLQLLLQKKQPMPAAVTLMSPMLDMTTSVESYETRAEVDPIHQRKFIVAIAKGYLGEAGDENSPLTSPLFGDFSSMPPTLVQVGDCEVGRDEAVLYAEKIEQEGGVVELEVWDNMIHVFQLFPDELPEAQEAINTIGAFIRNHLASA